MAGTNKKFSELDSASALANGDLVALAQVDSGAETGYTSRKTTVGALANKIATDNEFTTALSRFTDKTLTGAINENLDNILDLLPIDEASGGVANFDTDVVLPLIDVKAEIKALETGTGAKSPSNPYVISGFTGAVIGHQNGDSSKALYFRNLFLGTYNFVNLGSLEWDRLSTDTTGKYRYRANIPDMKQGAWSAVGLLCSKYEIVASVYNVSVTGLTISTSEEYRRVLIHDSEIDTVTPEEFATAMDGVYLIYELATPATPTITPAQYQALCTAFGIVGTLHTVSWQTEAGEVFGGYYDFTTGKLVVTWGSTNLGDLTWVEVGSGEGLYFYADISNMKALSSWGVSLNALSGIYTGVSGNSFINNPTNYTFSGQVNYNRVRIRNNDYSNKTDFKAGMDGVYIYYELITPVEYDLTPQQISPFLGVNNIWNDTNGDTTVDYKLGIQKYIDKKIAEVQALVL